MHTQRKTSTGMVLRLVEFRDQATRKVLRALASKADNGSLRGVLVCYVSDDGIERFVSTGRYKGFANAVNAAARLQHLLLQLQEDQVEG